MINNIKWSLNKIISILYHILWQRLHSIPFSSSSSSLPISISQFGFVPLSLLANLTCRAEPDLEFEGLLKRQHTRVKYFQGSLMNAMDLERAKVAAAKNLEKSTKTNPTSGVNIIYSPLPHLVIVFHLSAAFFLKRPSASKALQQN